MIKTTMPFSGKRLRPLFCALLLAVSGACVAAYNVWTSEYTFTRQELQTAIATQFPRSLNYMGLFDVNLTNPQLTLHPDSNRLTTTVNALIDNKLLLSKPVNGKLSMSSALKYDSVAHAVRLDAPVVDSVDIAGVPAQYAPQLNAIGNAVAEQILKNYALYTFKPEQLEMNGKRFEPGAITVLGDGIKVEIRQQ